MTANKTRATHLKQTQKHELLTHSACSHCQSSPCSNAPVLMLGTLCRSSLPLLSTAFHHVRHAAKFRKTQHINANPLNSSPEPSAVRPATMSQCKVWSTCPLDQGNLVNILFQKRPCTLAQNLVQLKLPTCGPPRLASTLSSPVSPEPHPRRTSRSLLLLNSPTSILPGASTPPPCTNPAPL